MYITRRHYLDGMLRFVRDERYRNIRVMSFRLRLETKVHSAFVPENHLLVP